MSTYYHLSHFFMRLLRWRAPRDRPFDHGFRASRRRAATVAFLGLLSSRKIPPSIAPNSPRLRDIYPPLRCSWQAFTRNTVVISVKSIWITWQICLKRCVGFCIGSKVSAVVTIPATCIVLTRCGCDNLPRYYCWLCGGFRLGRYCWSFCGQWRGAWYFGR